MKPLPIKKKLSEDTRLSSIYMGASVLVEIHRDPDGESVYYITEHANPENIFMMTDRELWNNIFE